MKKLKLKKWVKVVLVIVSAIVAYNVAIVCGSAVKSSLSEFFAILTWTYLFLGVPALLILIENK